MNNALRNSIARPSLRAAVNSQDLVIDSGAASSLRPVQPGHCLNLVSASSQYVDSGLTVTGGAAIDVSFTINPDSTFNGLLGCGGDVNTNKGFLLNQVAGSISISSADGTTLFGSSFTGLTISSGAWYECRLVWDGGTSTPTLTVDGFDYVTAGTISGWAGASGENLKFGDAAGAYFDGQLGFCKHAGFLQYNNDFSTGTSAIDSSGNNNDGTLVNGPTWTTSDTLPYSWLNQVGYGGSSRVVWSGGAGWDDGCYSEESAAGDFVVRMPITEAAVNQFLGVNSDPTTTGGFTTLDNALLMTSSFTLAAYESGVSKLSTSFIIGDVVEIIRVGTTITYLKNSVVFYTSLVSSTAILYVDTAFNGDGSNVSNVTLDGVYLTWVDVPNCTVSNLYIPRDEATPANDAFGNALEWSGSAFPRRPVYRDSYAGVFDGTDDTIITPLIPDNDTATFTLSAWVKPSVTGSLDGIIGAFEVSNDQISLQRHSSDKYRVRYGTGAGNTLLEATTTPSTSRWDMVTATYDGATMIIYVNGVEENRASVAAFSGGNVAYRVGGYQGSSFAWQGSLRDAVITSDVFTATEVLDMFTDGAVPVLSDGLRYPIAEGVGATAHDISGNGNDGTITNASTATEGAGFWAGRIDGEANAHNINNGFSLYSILARDKAPSGWGESGGVGSVASSIDFSLCNRVTQTNHDRFVGVDSSPSPSNLHTDLDYSFYFTGSGTVQIWEAGSNKGSFGGTRVIGDNYELRRSGTTITYYKNGALLYTSLTASSATLTPNAVLFSDNSESGACSFDGVPVVWSIVLDVDKLTLRVPADSAAPTLDVYGDALTNPAVANSHNDAETTWDFENIGTGDTIAPETDHFANFDAVTFSDTNYSLGITSPIDSVFWRDISTVLKDRATGYGATLTGAGLVYANNYTDGERWNNLAPWDDNNIWND